MCSSRCLKHTAGFSLAVTRRLLPFLLLTLVGTACSLLRPAASDKDSYATWEEDLGPFLPRFEGQADAVEEALSSSSPSVIAFDRTLAEVAEALREQRSKQPYYNAYTVLVFSGISREGAFTTREEIQEDFPEMEIIMQYQDPRYLVKVGKFLHRFEALDTYFQLKAQFPMTRIISDRFVREAINYLK
ncbi:hypothetical protein A3SI_06189 [Nitritalea halalkaliphila LW7]|uniref:SPOR domain-containing protein n=1 Tax=Nitritalea halalkaliphila LW7 TaxID=1189621 RepID=I5C7D7_9BACT|nr:hypothetical protein [Nitritalea halalkaliphila]EIM77739.1 hypothetical protein A3SI_06189 [Nitritalea halalkaliphila LW7]